MLWKIVKKNLPAPLMFLLILVLASCGGGGGSSSSNDRVNAPAVAGSSNSISVEEPELALSEETTVTVSLRNPDNTPAVDVPVKFTTTLGTLDDADGVVLTDEDGKAVVGLSAGGTSGQGQVLATATVSNRVVNLSTLFSVLLPPLKLGTMAFTNNSSSTIDYGSSQGITVEILDANGNPFDSQGVQVTFSSPQVAKGAATISSPVLSVNGKATTTYQAVTATGSDTITASIAGDSKALTLTINPLVVGSLTFVDATPATIGLKGMGGVGAQETSTVTFKVRDTTGKPMANQPVSFALNTTVGELSLSATSGSTAADGTVSTIVRSGRVATPVRVTASTKVGTQVLSTQSDVLVVSTGVAAQDGFSISVSDTNPEAYFRDGVAVQVTARLSDHFHNPVPDGTAVSFTTSGGSITPSCVTSGGVCSVTWRSQNPRPPAGDDRPAGRAVILAYAIGEEAFVDLNGNGLADSKDTYSDDGEAFIDLDEDGLRNVATETFVDFNGDHAYNLGDKKYNGVLQGADFAGAAKSKHVFSNSVLVMSTGRAVVSMVPAAITAPGSYVVKVRDANGNTMPSGTTIAISAPFGTLSGATSHTVPENIGFGVDLPFHIAASANPKPSTGILTVTVTSPSGLVTTKYLDMSGNF